MFPSEEANGQQERVSFWTVLRKRGCAVATVAVFVVLLTLARQPRVLEASLQPLRKLRHPQIPSRLIRPAAAEPPLQLAKTCGAAQQHGLASFGTPLTHRVAWSQLRSGVACTHVKFRKPFGSTRHTRVFVTADRTDSGGRGVCFAWAERVRRDSFAACVRVLRGTAWRERVTVGWWAVDAGRNDWRTTFVKRFGGAVERDKTRCRGLPRAADPDTWSVLASTSHEGLAYVERYSYRRRRHTRLESVATWVMGGNSSFVVCSRRLGRRPRYVYTDVDVVSVRRDQRRSGLTKVLLAGGTGCAEVRTDLAGLRGADEKGGLPVVLVSGRSGEGAGEGGAGIVTWVERRGVDGFTVCGWAFGAVRHSVLVSWVAVDGAGGEVCREGARAE